jgi:hypothetical protein
MITRPAVLAFAFLPLLLACSGSSAPAAGGSNDAGSTCTPSDPACRSFSHTYSTLSVTPGQEIGSLCQSFTLNNPEEIWVNAVEIDNDGAYHHSNWFYVPNTKYADQPDGTWDCATGGFDELGAAVAGGVLFAQSTQSKREVQKFPDGVAIRIPPWSRIVGSTHLLNASAQTVQTTFSMKVTSIPLADVKTKLTPFRLTYHDLHLPPQTKSRFTSQCDLKAAAEKMTGKPFSLSLYYALPHYHKLGTHFALGAYGDKGTTSVDDLDGFDGEAHGKAFDPPVDLANDHGFSFSCEYTNPTPKEVGWGIGDQEMCEMLGFADSPLAYDAYVKDGDNKVMGTNAGVVDNAGPCTVIGIAWSFDRPGGTPPTQ